MGVQEHITKYSKVKPPQPISFKHYGSLVVFYFIHYRQGWHWITHGTCRQCVLPEYEVCEFLGISERTARAWRNHRKKPDHNALFLLWLHMTGNILPLAWQRKGFAFVGNDLLCTRNPEPVTLDDAQNLPFYRWHFQQTKKKPGG